ncbi:metallophosphoesterase [Maritimibacter alexandrii]|uniref:metallophosphoesterase n=1 Tax=Maritimibacter alexandrii TaxID=2570355 RepID=UPI00110867AA|nr:metallophosphoesterase [Maritimibacter alexandrii]
MVGFLGKLLGRSNTEDAAPAFAAPLAPSEPLCIIGDVHGCDTLLSRMLDHLDGRDEVARVVCVGDYIDRGEQSRAVLDLLRPRDDGDRFTCLQGNHEEAMLDFITDPDGHGRRWLRFGGLQTLASYGIGGLSEQSTGDAVTEAAAALAEALGPDMMNWLRAMPLWTMSGNLGIVHAAADPTKPLEDQSGHALKWGHRDFPDTMREDRLWIAHGHTIIPEARAAGGIISVDTGAYATGRLSGIIAYPDGRAETVVATYQGVSCGYP